MLHLSQVCLVSDSNDKIFLKTRQGEESEVCLAVLQNGKCESIAFDMFFSPEDEIELLCVGKGEIHLTGYFDMRPDDHEHDSECDDETCVPSSKKVRMMDDDDEVDEEDEEEDDEEELDEEEMMAALMEGDSDEEDDDEEDEDDDEEDEEEDGKIVEVDDAEAEKIKSQTKAPEPKTTLETSDKKRKGPAPTETNVKKAAVEKPAATKAAVEKPAEKTAVKTDAKAEDDYAKTIVNFIKENGKSDLAKIGSKCPKPAAVSDKLGAFLKKRSEFKFDGKVVELKA